MKEGLDIKEILGKAKESLDAAKSLMKDRFYDFSASRSYYAMFYAAEAILLTKGLSYSKHRAVISAFGKYFIKTGALPECLHRYIIDAFDLRQIGDYGPMGSISKEGAGKLMSQAKEFTEAVEEYLKKEGYGL